MGTWKVHIGRSPIMRGVGAGRSAQRGTSAATTGGGGRSAPDPEYVLARLYYDVREAGSWSPSLLTGTVVAAAAGALGNAVVA